MAARFAHDERNQDATIYIGGIDEKTTDSLIWELMLQVGPVVSVHLPKDRVSQTHQGYGFCEFQTEEDADYAVKVMNGIKLFGRPIRVNKASADKKAVINVGADLHVSGLDPSIDERQLLNIFSTFGPLMAPPRVRPSPFILSFYLNILLMLLRLLEMKKVKVKVMQLYHLPISSHQMPLLNP
jgi:splicing factor 3B subunit 4